MGRPRHRTPGMEASAAGLTNVTHSQPGQFSAQACRRQRKASGQKQAGRKRKALPRRMTLSSSPSVSGDRHQTKSCRTPGSSA